MPITLSWNTLSTYLKCPLQFRFQKDKVEYPKDSRNAILGIVVQKLFELWINEGHFWDGSSWLYRNFDRVWAECQGEGKPTGGWGAWCPWEDKSQENKCMEDSREQIGNLFAMITEHKLLAKKMASEFRFKGALPTGDQVCGSIDFMLDKPTQKYVLDAKGTKYKTRYLDKRQLVYYKLGMVLEHGAEWQDAETAWLIYRNKLYERVLVSDADLDNMSDLCVQVCNDIRAEKFEPKLGESCRFCNWKGSCPAKNVGATNDSLFGG